jgi:hypothetical protein
LTSLAERSPAPEAAHPAHTTTAWWRLELVLLAVVLVGMTALLPLYDPDLPMHLATGEWIVAHRAVPLVEPFAWTRAGDPFFAYSWLPETIFYLVHRELGPIGLRLLQGLLMGGVAFATATLGRVAGWRFGTILCLSAFAVLVAALVTPSLRPQIVLLIVLPLVWAEIVRIRAGASVRSRAIALVLLSALAANAHLFFVLVLAPVALLLADRPIAWSRAIGAAGCLAAGWLLTPYVLHWPELLRSNFAPNAILQWPSPIAELQPGFLSFPNHEVGALPALALLLLPWSGALARRPARERLLAVGYWVVGLIGFAYAFRLLAVWWLLVLPVAGWVVDDRASREPDQLPRRAIRLPAYLVLFGLLVANLARSARNWAREGTVESRTLATVQARGAEPLAAWLAPRLRPGADGRLLTVFNYGSYLTWRLPRLSPSVDGRSLFPDSVALPEAFVPADAPSIPLPPWRSAELAIAPLDRRISAVLDTATGWRRVAEALPDSGRQDASALWVRESWWQRSGVGPLPATPVRLSIPDAR